MHSDIGPQEEAHAVYLRPSRLAERLARSGTDAVILWDVGLGIAGNALAAIELATEAGGHLEIHSFESQLGGLRLALENPAQFPWLNRYSAKVGALLEKGEWSEGDIHWRLHIGRFDPSHASAPRADVIFYDFYAPSVDPTLWGYGAFSRLHPWLKEDGILCTYSCSTAVRAALLLSGFKVGRGTGTARKRETTLASPSRQMLEDPLTATWLEKLRRSHVPFPADAPEATRAWELLDASF